MRKEFENKKASLQDRQMDTHVEDDQNKQNIFHDSDDSEYSGESLPIPAVQYEWGDAFTSSTPIGRYSCSTISRGQSRLDELKLNLVFDVNSMQLPTKLQLEIKDKSGRIVFRLEVL